MNLCGGDMAFIKLDRKFKEWRWKHNPNMVAVWVHLLLEANYKENVWNDTSIPAGSLITSVKKIAEETGLSIQQTRTCLSNLQTTNEITIKSTNKYSIITITKWEQYQSTRKNQQTKQQTDISKSNNQITSKSTTLKEDKEYKKNIYDVVSKKRFIDFKNKWVEAGYDEQLVDTALNVCKQNLTEHNMQKVMNILTNSEIVNPIGYIQTLKQKGAL